MDVSLHAKQVRKFNYSINIFSTKNKVCMFNLSMECRLYDGILTNWIAQLYKSEYQIFKNEISLLSNKEKMLILILNTLIFYKPAKLFVFFKHENLLYWLQI